MMGEEMSMIGREKWIMMDVKYEGKNDGKEGRKMLIDGWWKIDKRIGENIGEDKVERRIGKENRMEEKLWSWGEDMLWKEVIGGILWWKGEGNRVDICRENRDWWKNGNGNWKKGDEGEKIKRIGRVLGLEGLIDKLKEEGSGEMVEGEERKEWIDLDGDIERIDIV